MKRFILEGNEVVGVEEVTEEEVQERTEAPEGAGGAELEQHNPPEEPEEFKTVSCPRCLQAAEVPGSATEHTCDVCGKVFLF